MSGNGDFIAVSVAPAYERYNDDELRVHVYHSSNSSGRDVVMPVEMEGLQNFGEALSLSANGDFLAVGSFGSDNLNWDTKFFVHTYTWNGISYAFDGNVLFDRTDLQTLSSHSLQAVALSSDALVLAIGSEFDTTGRELNTVVYQRTQTDLE
jgi:hypothetical protein